MFLTGKHWHDQLRQMYKVHRTPNTRQLDSLFNPQWHVPFIDFGDVTINEHAEGFFGSAKRRGYFVAFPFRSDYDSIDNDLRGFRQLGADPFVERLKQFHDQPWNVMIDNGLVVSEQLESGLYVLSASAKLAYTIYGRDRNDSHPTSPVNLAPQLTIYHPDQIN
jgi:hypothetical protein